MKHSRMSIAPSRRKPSQFLAECLVRILLTSLCLPLSTSSIQANSSATIPHEHELTREVSIQQEVGGGGSQTYAARLLAGQYVRVLITKQDLKLTTTLYGPDGRPLSDFQSRRYGPSSLSFVADAAGLYRLEVRSLESEPGSRGYQLSVEALRAASAQDSADADACKAFSEAEKLRAEWKEESLREAVRKYGEALTRWQSIPRPQEAVGALESIGETYFTLSDYPQAIAFYQKALAMSRRTGKNTLIEHRILNSLGDVFSHAGRDRQALGHFRRIANSYERARPAQRGVAERREEARALCGMGVIYTSQGDLRLALDYFRRAQDIFTEVGDRGGQALVHLNSFHAHMDSGDSQTASADFEQALALWRATGDRRGEALALMAGGSINALQGKKQLAFEAQQAALNIFRLMGDRLGEALALNGVARAYEELNEMPTALDNYFQALKLYQQNNSWEFECATECAIGRVYRWMGDNERARAHYARSIVLSRKVNRRRLEAYALLEIAIILKSSSHTQQALHQYYKILKLYQSIGDRRGQAKVFNNIGDIFYSSEDKRQALSYYKRALPLTRSAKDLNGEATTLYNVARAERACGQPGAALASIKSALAIIEFLRVQIASPTLRSSYFTSIRNYYGFYIDLLMQLDKERPRQGFAGAALEASESARARALLELLTESKIDIRQGVAPELLERESSLRQLLSAKAQYRTRLLNGRNADAESEELEREIRRLIAEYEEVQARIREQSPRYAVLTQPQPLRVEDIQAELSDGQTLLLEYALGEDKSYLWAVDSTSVESYELPGRATVEAAAAEVYKLLTARQSINAGGDAAGQTQIAEADRRYEEQARALSDMLLGPVAGQLGTRRLLIVPDGALQYIPFVALPSPSVSGRDEEQSPDAPRNESVELVPLVVRHEVINLPSASTLAALRQEISAPPDDWGIVAVLADPVFESDDPRVKTSEHPRPDRGDTDQRTSTLRSALKDKAALGSSLRLPFTLREAEGIMTSIPSGAGMLATGVAADRATAMSAQLRRYQIVHFATHGLIDSERPEFSGIVLSLVDEQGNPKDGFLQLHDIYNLDLSAKLVVLSACDTGLGKDVKGEGLIGLTRGFMYAGSKSVMASLWKVDDRATADLMSHFYRALVKERLPPSAALRWAQVEMWKQSRWRVPYYWAAFVLQGEYSQSIQINRETRESTKLPVLFSIVGASAMIGFYAFRRRKRVVKGRL